MSIHPLKHRKRTPKQDPFQPSSFRRTTRRIALLMSGVLFLNLLNLPVFGEAFNGTDSYREAEIDRRKEAHETGEEKEKATVVTELKERREESIKHYLMSDGSIQAIVYAHPVHYQDQTGEWKEIDNTLTEQREKRSDTYRNKANDLKVSFAGQSRPGAQESLVRLEKDGYIIGWKYIEPEEVSEKQPEEETDSTEPTSTQPGTIETQGPNLSGEDSMAEDCTETVSPGSLGQEQEDREIPSTQPEENSIEETIPEEKENSFEAADKVLLREEQRLNNIPLTIEDAVSLPVSDNEEASLEKAVRAGMENTVSTVTYREALRDTDFSYQLIGRSLKENIILRKTKSSYTYRFLLQTEGLTLVLDKESREILAKDPETEETIYRIPAPVMYDAAGADSTAVGYELKETGEGEWILTIEADPEWINAKERTFPVTIDPVIITETKQSVHSTFVCSGSSYAGTNMSSRFEWIIGNTVHDYYQCWGLIQFDLPELNPGDMVVEAQMSLVLRFKSAVDPSVPLEIDAHRATGSWQYNTVTWNTKPGYDPAVCDYDTVTAQDPEEGYTQKLFNITKAVKSWYSGTTNNGILLKPKDATVKTKAQFIPERYNDYPTGYYPYVVIAYRNNKGIEPYWDYTSAGAGSAGSIDVNTYSGNPVITHGDAATSGLRMPVSLSHVYNGYLGGKNYTQADNYPDKLKPYTGYGWKLNLQQTVLSSSCYGLTGESRTKWPYVYTDGDGTEHYFMKTEEGKYQDEDGLGLELKVLTESGTQYTIEDEKGNRLSFNQKGFLTEIRDANGTAAALTYSGNYLTKITDGAGHTLTLEYTGDTLRGITDPEGKKTTYTYTNGLLTRITYPDKTYSSYSYDTDKALITLTGKGGEKILLSYTSKATGKQVRAIQEYGTGNTLGQKITFDRTEYNVTKIRSAGTDGIHGNSDDRITVYQFDNAGRTTGTQVTGVDGTLYGAYSSELTPASPNSTGSDIKKLNRISREGSQGGYADNLFNTGSFESLTGWTGGAKGGALQSYSQDTTNRYFGKRSLKLTVSSCPTGGAGEVYQELTNQVLIPGQTYTASVYIKLPQNLSQSPGTEEDWGAGILITTYPGSASITLGEGEKYSSELLQRKTEEDINQGWRRVHVTFTVPEGSGRVRIGMSIQGATGTAYYDGAQIEKGEKVSPYNMIGNSGFEAAQETEWTGHNLSTGDGVSTERAHTGTHSFKIQGHTGSYPYETQIISLSGSVYDTYLVSAWAWAEAVPNREGNRDFKIDLYIEYTDGSYVWKSAPFNSTVSGWQYLCFPFDLYSPGKEGKTPTLVRVDLSYEHQAGPVYFDDIQLIRDESRSYTYDTEGNLITVSENAEQKSRMEYSNHNLIRETDAKGYDFTYTYDAKHNMTQAKSQNGVTYNYTYNSAGQPTDLTIGNSSATEKIKTEVTYSPAGNGIREGAYLSEVKDADGQTGAVYIYNNQSGLLQEVTDGAGTTTSYTYDNNHRLTGIGQGEESVTYTYDTKTDRLTAIQTPKTAYSFTYDPFGNPLQIKAGSSTLCTYTYQEHNGLLESIRYGSNHTVGYSYDSLGRLIGQTENETEKYGWSYGTGGQAIGHVDKGNGLRYDYDYDSIGRFIRESVFRTEGEDGRGSRLYTVEYGYDELNNVIKVANEAFGSLIIQNQTYGKDNLPLSHTASTGVNVTYIYDGLDRLTGQSLNTTSPILTTYGYESSGRGAGYTTTRLQTEILGNVAYRYTRDVLGNITKIEEGRRSGSTGTGYVTKVRYRYDSQSQLIWESSLYTGKTREYTYSGGNITQVKEWDRYMEEPTRDSPSRTKTYGYGNSGWKDQLTYYNGDTVFYDSLGNPVFFRGGIYLTWKGRRLATLRNSAYSSEDCVYSYGADGIRVKKTAKGVTTEYEYVNGTLLAEKRSDGIVLHYTYDPLGNLSSIRYTKANGTAETYYVRCNVAGDVEQLYNTSGALAAIYRYDSWGTIVSIKDGNGNEITEESHIAKVNPIRYRGYYYDEESGFYYIGSRYYDPVVGRWVSGDTTDVLSLPYYHSGQYNLYAYCNNNPVNDRDDDGQLSWFAKIAIGAAAIAIGVGVTALTGGAALPALVAGVKAACVAGAISAGTSAATTAVRSAVSGDNFSTIVQKSAKAAIDGFADGFMAGGIAAGASQIASGGFKIAAKLGAKTGKSGGIKIGNTKILSPDAAWHKNNGGTLLKVEKTFRIDVGSNTLLHMHLPNVSSHIQIGTIGAGIYGVLK